MSTKLQERIAALEAELSAIKAEAAKPAWPWVPEHGEKHFSTLCDGLSPSFTWAGHKSDSETLARFNVYRTEEEAQARAALDLRLSIHAALRQLGGGDVGEYAVAYDRQNRIWCAIYERFVQPGQASFTTQAAAQAALDTLLDRGILKHGELK